MDSIHILTKILPENQECFMDSSEIELIIENKKGFIIPQYIKS